MPPKREILERNSSVLIAGEVYIAELFHPRVWSGLRLTTKSKTCSPLLTMEPSHLGSQNATENIPPESLMTPTCYPDCTMLNSELRCCTVALRNYTLLHALTSNNALYFIRCTVVLQNPILKLRDRRIGTTVSSPSRLPHPPPKILHGTDLFDFFLERSDLEISGTHTA